ncbi:MAG: DUF262 domain-containing protein [Deltaproteobacteria bacterium]|jgi:hypothetical protein|nr:DUF262 domain-containing protein [Deltaproteobacteria bacterium]
MPSSFKSGDYELKKYLLPKIHNGEIQLPDFQRDWVWDDDRIRQLIASIVNSYPIGALMFLEYYHNENIKFKYRHFTNIETEARPDLLVLDGQQRLTAMYCALYSEKPIETRNRNKKVSLYYYIDIENSLKDRVNIIDSIISVPYNKVFVDPKNHQTYDLISNENEYSAHMFPLNIIFDSDKFQKWYGGYIEYHNSNFQEIFAKFSKFREDILESILNYSVPVIILTKETTKEAVCQVFEHVNTGGVSLSVFDLVTASFAISDFQLREDLTERRKALAELPSHQANVLSEFSETYFLTSVTLLASYYRKQENDSAEVVSCKKGDVLSLSVEDYNQYIDRLIDGLTAAARFLNENRIFTAKDLPYNTQIIPLAVLMVILKNQLDDNSVKSKINWWYWCGVFGELYSSAIETRFAADVTEIPNWLDGRSEPDTVVRSFFQPTRLLTLVSRNSAAYKGLMARILKNGALDLKSGSPIDFATYSNLNVDIHHIFPQKFCKDKEIPHNLTNCVVNKTPISSRTNQIIGGDAPSEYLKKLETNYSISSESLNSYLQTHLINPVLIRSDSFQPFFNLRAKALLNLISQATGRAISNLDSPEVIQAFGGPLK